MTFSIPTPGDGYKPTAEEREAYSERLAEATEREHAVPIEMYKGQNVIWKPQQGSQTRFMATPFFESLYHGTRGGGKTDTLLMSYAQHVGKGHAEAWRGIIFRQTYPQLADVQAKSEKWFRQMFGKGAKFNRTKMQWEWKTGEVLLLRHMMRPSDYWNYHGHEYPFIGFEELCNWADEACYLSMFACCRTATPGVPRMVRATTNPYGPGHNWVKERFRLYQNWRRPAIFILDATDEQGREEPERAAYHSHIDENKILLRADPKYKQAIVASATNPAMAEAWLDGSWDIVAGGMFDDVWKPQYNAVPDFYVPHSWRIDRSFDWGSSRPFSVGWWAQSDGTDLTFLDGRVKSTVKGDIFRIREWYGWNGHANQGVRALATDIASGIIEREISWGLRRGNDTRVQAGPADNSIHDVENGVSIALDMAKPQRVQGQMFQGVAWHRADKRPGSRKNGWEHMRRMLRDAWPNPDGRPRENAGLFVIDGRCDQFVRTVPSLPRDEKDPDDADTKAEDHIADETRYRVRFSGQQSSQSTHVGMF